MALPPGTRLGPYDRELKPLNVMLTKSGPKLLDFGLAKALAPTTDVVRGFSPAAPGGPKGPHYTAPAVSLSAETTATTAAPATAKGTILGAIHYTAPEQVEGRAADTRSDIWALGALLYEMATGHPHAARALDAPGAHAAGIRHGEGARLPARESAGSSQCSAGLQPRRAGLRPSRAGRT